MRKMFWHFLLTPTAKQWKRMVTKVTFVGQGFTRKPPKYERFIRPTGLRFTKAHVTHPELKCTFNLEIIGIKKNPNGPMYTSLGVVTKGTIIEVSDTIGDDILHMLRTALYLLRIITNWVLVLVRVFHFRHSFINFPPVYIGYLDFEMAG